MAIIFLTNQEDEKMFNSVHISYMIISGLITIALLVLLRIFCKSEKSKSIAVRFFAVITVIIHYSSLWVDFFTTGSAMADASMLLPLYACNICMWLLLITAFVKKSDNFAYRTLSEFAFWAGCVCGFIGILLNEQFGINPDISNYHILKGLLSHSTMIVGAALLAVLGFVKIRVKSVLSVAIGLTLFVVDGAVINALFAYFELPPCNSMYLLEVPFADLPWLNGGFIAIASLSTAFVLSALFEQTFLQKNERWYMLISRKRQSK